MRRKETKDKKLEDNHKKFHSWVKGILEGMKNKNKEDEITYKIIWEKFLELHFQDWNYPLRTQHNEW